MYRFFLALALACLQATTLAEPQPASEHFQCGGARVALDIVNTTETRMELRQEGVLRVAIDGVETVLRYRGGGIDFIGATCVNDAQQRPLVVYQAYCGGSGCRDLDNWGIIEPRSLRVLLVPNDHNRGEAERRLGTPLPTLRLLSYPTP